MKFQLMVSILIAIIFTSVPSVFAQEAEPASNKASTSISFDKLPDSIYAGMDVVFSGHLSSDSKPLTGKTIKILEDDSLIPDETLIKTTTDQNGNFLVVWEAEAQLLERELDIYALFESDDEYNRARSDNQEMYIYRYGGSITLNDFPRELKEGTTVTFEGKLSIDHHSSEGAVVYIKDEDTGNPDDLLATAYVDKDGNFSVDWVARHTDTDDPFIEIYAVFEGNNILGRLTTCDTGYTSPLGGLCFDTITVKILDMDTPSGTTGDNEYVELLYAFDFDTSPHIAIVPNPDSFNKVKQHIIPAQEGVLMWTNELEYLYGGNWNVTFEVIEPGSRFTQEPDVIINLDTYDDNPSCGVDYAGVAYLEKKKPVQTIVCSSTPNETLSNEYVSLIAAHEFIHAMGLGHVFNKPNDMMCSVEPDYGHTCPNSWYDETTPSELSLAGVVALYAQDGYTNPNNNVTWKDRFSFERELDTNSSTFESISIESNDTEFITEGDTITLNFKSSENITNVTVTIVRIISS